ncbi:DUF6688 domain-containing protein [Cohnella nanjingensis]|uniref:Uncharacterized protein n=1 Tax=Cohnella nanjingensis TaxID=1387779 RepID=A0A7X0RRV8_9BACL|nr:DUF6688 family protein [Cohnella nanjingensis]MBB6671280.1 hypothetical protein [Cohnella nanjingensis]
MLLFFTPFLLLAFAAFSRTVIAFARKEGKREQTASRIFDGILLSIASLLLIVGFVFDLHGVPGGAQLKVYSDTGEPIDAYASLSPKHSAAVYIDWLLGFFSYWALRIYHRRLSPIVYTCCNAFLALCVSLTAVYFYHTGFTIYGFNEIFSVLLIQTGSLTSCLLYLAQLKRSFDVWMAFQREDEVEIMPSWQRPLYRFMLRRWTFPALWFALLFPAQLAVQLLLVLFGQRPDGVVRAFLDTSGFHLSRLPAPPPELVAGDGHYLCTVAARGHRLLVKPLRAGIRHGAAIPVNRQLMIANAFENVLEQYMPASHRTIRRLYDKYGYPVSRHIRTKVAADAIYVAMKPLEWLFLLVLYTVDVRPENRIHVQYSGFGKKERSTGH